MIQNENDAELVDYNTIYLNDKNHLTMIIKLQNVRVYFISNMLKGNYNY